MQWSKMNHPNFRAVLSTDFTEKCLLNRKKFNYEVNRTARRSHDDPSLATIDNIEIVLLAV